MAMDPVTCPMCEGAIPGKEIQTVKTCPSCGADLSALVRKRLAMLRPAPAPAPQPPPFLIAQAALFSLLAPCFGIAVNLLGHRALSGNPVGMRMLGTVCSLLIVGGFIFGVVAVFAPKGAKSGTKGKAITGIFINGLLISFAIFGILTRQKVAASGNNPPEPHRKGSIFIFGK
jgi:hypothetical protein